MLSFPAGWVIFAQQDVGAWLARCTAPATACEGLSGASRQSSPPPSLASRCPLVRCPFSNAAHSGVAICFTHGHGAVVAASRTLRLQNHHQNTARLYEACGLRRAALRLPRNSGTGSSQGACWGAFGRWLRPVRVRQRAAPSRRSLKPKPAGYDSSHGGRQARAQRLVARSPRAHTEWAHKRGCVQSPAAPSPQ